MLANVVLSTLVVCIPSTLLAVLIGVFAGYFIKVKRFKYRKVLIRIVYTLSGLLIYILLSRKGPLGFLDMLFTKWAMIITQVILIVPIVMLYTLSGLKNIDRVLENLDYLNIKGRKRYTAIMKEYSKEIMYAIVLGLSRSISEVGGVLIVGGNIEGSTRILTTAIIFEITKGEFSNALMLGLVLLAISFTFNTILQILQGDVFD